MFMSIRIIYIYDQYIYGGLAVARDFLRAYICAIPRLHLRYPAPACALALARDYIYKLFSYFRKKSVLYLLLSLKICVEHFMVINWVLSLRLKAYS